MKLCNTPKFFRGIRQKNQVLDVTGHIRGKPDLDPYGFALEYPEARPDEFFETEIVRDLKGLLCLVEHLDPVQGKDPDLVSHVAVADQVEGPVNGPDFVGILIALCLLICPKDP